MTDAVAIWNAVLNEAVAPFSFGTVARGSSEDVFFRVKNLSPFLTAYAPLVELVAVGGLGAPVMVAQHLLSLDGETFAATVVLEDLGPREFSPSIALRRATATDAQAGSWSALVRATPTSWGLDTALIEAVEV